MDQQKGVRECATDDAMVLEWFAKAHLSILAILMCLSDGLGARI